jgi:hypothetical protein
MFSGHCTAVQRISYSEGSSNRRRQNIDALTMTVTAEFDADAERLWELWLDPRQLERWWGPPSHPSTFVEHELTVGARATYLDPLLGAARA